MKYISVLLKLIRSDYLNSINLIILTTGVFAGEEVFWHLSRMSWS